MLAKSNPSNRKCFTYLPIFLLFLAILLPLPALADGKWVSFGDTEMPEGTPPIIKVLEDDSYHTTMEITIPGMWVEEVNEGGYTFQKLEIPDFATLGDIGKPAIPAIGQFVGFLEPSTNSIEYKDEDKVVLEDMLIYPEQKPIFDDEDYGFDFDKEFYSQDIWYPKERASVSETSIMREVCVAHTGIVPFEYNPAKRELIVHPQMLATVYHKPGAEGYEDWSMPIGADPDFVDMYRGVIVNYENLGMPEVDTTTGYDYLIITPDEFSSYAQALANLLQSSGGYDVCVQSYNHYLDHDEVRNEIWNFYLQNHNDYVLLFGNIDYIGTDYVPDPENQGLTIYSDISYVCYPTFTPIHPYPIPQLAIGRFSVQDVGDIEVQLGKIADHYSIWHPELMLKSLLVASKKHDPKDTDFVAAKTDIRMTNYPLYSPSFTQLNGTESGIDDTDVILAIGQGYQIVNYFGHSDAFGWNNWDLCYEDFPYEAIYQIIYLQNPPFRPVVFNVTCLTGDFVTTWPDECQAESWMNLPQGAEGVIAATRVTNSLPNKIFDKWLFKTLYGYSENGHVYGGEGHLGMIMNWANIKMMGEFYGGETFRIALHNFYSYLVFGDPSLYIVPIYSEFGKGDNDKRIQKEDFTSKTVIPSVSLYPNPATDNLNISITDSISGEMKIELYDLSGRLVMEQNYPIESGNYEITISLDSLNLNSGLYTVKLEGPQFSKTSKIVYIPQNK